MIKEYGKSRVFLGRLPFGGDLLNEVEKLAGKLNVKMGFIRILGAVSKGSWAFYDQDERRYYNHDVDEYLEIVSCYGNLSQMDGKEKAHIHVCFSGRDGRTVAGHLIPGSVIFAAEYYLEELSGEELQRCHDEETGLPLWKQETYV